MVESLSETLERAGVAVPGEIGKLAGDPWAYRNRIRLAFTRDGRFGYRGRRSHEIVPIGTWVLREACTQTCAWISEGLPIERVSVNVSAVEFNRKAFLDGVRNVLKDTGLEPWRLEIELTETAVMRDVTATSHVLEELSADGVRFAMDDFGTGYSSLNHLMLFPIDALKIDKSFVQDVRTNANAATIVTAIVQLGQSLELEVIAEGIETAEQFKFLALRGCDGVAV